MASSNKVVIALNGFLGQTSDWDLIPDLVPPGWNFHAIDLWSRPIADFDQWAQNFAQEIESQFGASTKKVLLAYSMGGRLGLHTLTQSPQTFAGAMIVSANPGLLFDDEKRLRIEADEVWASKFTHAPWDEVISEWNRQSVFRTSFALHEDAITLPRREADYDRKVLSDSLRTWSLGRQRDLRAEICKLKMPIEFVTGEFDLKFTSLTREFAAYDAMGSRDHLIISGAGHRVPWDAPSQFRVALANFLAHW